MNRGRHWIGGLRSSAAAALAAGLVASGAAAQQTSTPAPAPAPTPTPSPARLPNVIYLPNTSLGGTPAPTPAPPPPVTVAPVATPTPAPRPAATATPRAAAPGRTTPAPAPAPAQAAPASRPTPIPTAIATQAPAVPVPLATATPVAAPPAVVPAAAPAGTPGWLWALLGAGATALVFGGAWMLRRRRAGGDAEAAYAAPAAPAPPVPAPPVAPPPGIAPPPPPAAPLAPAGEPFEIALRPGSIEVTERDVLLDFELLIGNVQTSAAENIRLTMAMMSANPDQDRQIAGYHANPMVDPAGVPFDLAAGAGGRLPVRLALPRELIHVVEVQRRPMFVPLVMIEVKWRAGISIRRFGADFMVGTPGQGAKLGPIWLDRNQQARQLATTRYLPRQAVAA